MACVRLQLLRVSLVPHSAKAAALISSQALHYSARGYRERDIACRFALLQRKEAAPAKNAAAERRFDRVLVVRILGKERKRTCEEGKTLLSSLGRKETWSSPPPK